MPPCRAHRRRRGSATRPRPPTTGNAAAEAVSARGKPIAQPPGEQRGRTGDLVRRRPSGIPAPPLAVAIDEELGSLSGCLSDAGITKADIDGVRAVRLNAVAENARLTARPEPLRPQGILHRADLAVVDRIAKLRPRSGKEQNNRAKRQHERVIAISLLVPVPAMRRVVGWAASSAPRRVPLCP